MTETNAKPREERDEEKPGARVFLSASAVAAIVSALTTVASTQLTTERPGATADRVRVEVLAEVADKFVAKGVDDTRWTYYTQGVDERLRSIVEKLDAIERRTADLPKMAAKLELLERK